MRGPFDWKLKSSRRAILVDIVLTLYAATINNVNMNPDLVKLVHIDVPFTWQNRTSPEARSKRGHGQISIPRWLWRGQVLVVMLHEGINTTNRRRTGRRKHCWTTELATTNTADHQILSIPDRKHPQHSQKPTTPTATNSHSSQGA
jgi:hypothetical protein